MCKARFNYRTQLPAETVEEFKWSTVIIEILSVIKEQLQFEQLRLRVNGLIALSVFHFRIIVRSKLDRNFRTQGNSDVMLRNLPKMQQDNWQGKPLIEQNKTKSHIFCDVAILITATFYIIFSVLYDSCSV